VDIDPVAVAHSRLMLEGNDRTVVIQEDVRRPEQILGNSDVTQLLDFEQPVAVLMVAVFQFVSDTDDPVGVVRRLTEPLVSGSHLGMSVFTFDGMSEVDTQTGMNIYRRGGIEITPRPLEQAEALFAGFELVDPGLVWVPQWRPESPQDVGDNPESAMFYGGVGRKP
jgi:hypothetical protein